MIIENTPVLSLCVGPALPHLIINASGALAVARKTTVDGATQSTHRRTSEKTRTSDDESDTTSEGGASLFDTFIPPR
jgi:hypothetical protein